MVQRTVDMQSPPKSTGAVEAAHPVSEKFIANLESLQDKLQKLLSGLTTA
jgi:hypothetical protein